MPYHPIPWKHRQFVAPTLPRRDSGKRDPYRSTSKGTEADAYRVAADNLRLGLSVVAREPGSLARSLEKTQRVLVASPRPGRDDADAAGPAGPQGSLP